MLKLLLRSQIMFNFAHITIKDMKIGDKVAFLSETGGGVVAGFQGKNIVLVEDADGFQIPTPINDVVVVGSQNYDTGRMVADKEEPKAQPVIGDDNRSIRRRLNEEAEEEDYNLPDVIDMDRPITFKPQPEEREGGNKLNCLLAFVPIDIKEVGSTKFEVYFVNDSNYYVQYAYMTAEGQSWTLRSQAEVEPNAKYYIEEIGRDELNNMAHVGIQMIAYKKEKPFALKPTVEVRLRLDPVKFYKVHAFQENEFFDNPALLYKIIEDDKPAKPLIVDPDKLKGELYKQPEPVRKQVARRPEDKDKLVVDLHIDQLLDTTDGMSHQDILQYQLKKFREVLDENKSNHGKKIIFIHGKGEGVLRHSIVNDLVYRYKGYRYQDASFQEYGFGATEVTVK